AKPDVRMSLRRIRPVMPSRSDLGIRHHFRSPEPGRPSAGDDKPDLSRSFGHSSERIFR
ncbi:hypothetical protein AAVH_43723, partial [Aphelenchoides avenae]